MGTVIKDRKHMIDINLTAISASLRITSDTNHSKTKGNKIADINQTRQAYPQLPHTDSINQTRQAYPQLPHTDSINQTRQAYPQLPHTDSINQTRQAYPQLPHTDSINQTRQAYPQLPHTDSINQARQAYNQAMTSKAQLIPRVKSRLTLASMACQHDPRIITNRKFPACLHDRAILRTVAWSQHACPTLTSEALVQELAHSNPYKDDYQRSNDFISQCVCI